MSFLMKLLSLLPLFPKNDFSKSEYGSLRKGIKQKGKRQQSLM